MRVSARFGVTAGSGRPALILNSLRDVGYVVDNVEPPWKSEKRVALLAILAGARMVIWETRKKGLYDGANFSLRDLILFFRHQLRVKIKSERKRLGCITSTEGGCMQQAWSCESEQRWSHPFPAHGCSGLGPSGLYPE